MKSYWKKAMFIVLSVLLLLALVTPALAQSERRYSLGAILTDPAVLKQHCNSAFLKKLYAKPKPHSVDYSAYMPTPGDQGNQGSCVAWAVGYAYKSYQEQLEHGWSVQTPTHQFSPAYIYNQINGGEDNGSNPVDAFNLIQNEGVDTLNDFPYDDTDCLTQPKPAQEKRAASFKATDWTAILPDPGQSMSDAMKAVLAGHGPLTVGTAVYWNTGWDNGLGVISYADLDNPYAFLGGFHAICLVGYDDNFKTADGNGAFKFINSWGTYWGWPPGWGTTTGYGWISYDYADKEFLEAFTMTDEISYKLVTYNVSGHADASNYNVAEPPYYVFSQSGTQSGSTTSGADGLTQADTDGSTKIVWKTNPGSDGGETGLPPMKQIALGQTVNASLAEDDPVLSFIGQSYCDFYYFDVKDPNQRVAITMMRPSVPSDNDQQNNTALYPIILLCRLYEDGFHLESMANHDDGTVCNARLPIWPYYKNLTLPGRYYILAASLGGDMQTGDYSLTLTPEPAVPNVKVTFTNTSGGSAPPLVTTNANGIWSQSGFEEGATYVATPSKEGYVFEPQSITFTSNSWPLNLDFNGPYILVPPQNSIIHPGETVTISWSYSGNPGPDVRIELLKGGAKNMVIAASTPVGTGGQGSFTWTVPSDLSEGADYQIRITSNSLPEVVDTSMSIASEAATSP